MGRSQIDSENEGFKSKNLYAERRRRQKLSDRLLQLRALVPNITNAITQLLNHFNFFYLVNKIFKLYIIYLFPNWRNCSPFFQMTRATIITDSIDYIKELQKCVGDLSEKLHEMEVTIENEMKTENYEVDAAKEMKEWGIEVILYQNFTISLSFSLYLSQVFYFFYFLLQVVSRLFFSWLSFIGRI